MFRGIGVDLHEVGEHFMEAIVQKRYVPRPYWEGKRVEAFLASKFDGILPLDGCAVYYTFLFKHSLLNIHVYTQGLCFLTSMASYPKTWFNST